jgi:Ca2+-binding RTX toxin-like protein
MNHQLNHQPAERFGRRALLAAAVCAALAGAVLPSTAQAGLAHVLISKNAEILDYSDGFGVGETNDVTVRFANGNVIIEDRGALVRAGAGCRIDAAAAVCPFDPREGISVKAIQVSVKDGNDKVRYQAPHRGTVDVGAGNDLIFGGQRQPDSAGRIEPVRYEDLGGGFDTISYAEADRGVFVNAADSPGNVADDGRPGDQEDIGTASDSRFEAIMGSSFDDTLFGAPHAELFNGRGGRDAIAGGDGDETFISESRDGADDYHGGPGRDFISYHERRQPLNVTLDNAANDGESGELDNVRSNVENVMGGHADDTIRSLGAFSSLDGGPGTGIDILDGGAGPDTLSGREGTDSLSGGSGNDVIFAQDGLPDNVDCGSETDTADRDTRENRISGCEKGKVGVLKLAPKRIDATTGKQPTMRLSWRHPDGWRKLRSVTLRLTRSGGQVGEVTILPRSKRVTKGGFARVIGLARHGRTVSARLALRIDSSMTGQTLRLEVEATDTRGRRQLERNASILRIGAG